MEKGIERGFGVEPSGVGACAQDLFTDDELSFRARPRRTKPGAAPFPILKR